MHGTTFSPVETYRYKTDNFFFYIFYLFHINTLYMSQLTVPVEPVLLLHY